MQNETHLIRNILCGSVIGIALACAPSSQNSAGTQVTGLVEMAPVALSAPAHDDPSDGIELMSEEHLGDAGRSELVALTLVRDLRLIPSMDSVGLTEEYSAFVQDGVSKHGRRYYSDAYLPVLLRDRPFCVVRFRPFLNEDERTNARAKMMTHVLSNRLKNTDLARTLKRGEKLVFSVDRTTESYDKESKLSSIMLYPVNSAAHSPQFIARLKCVGAQSNVETLRASFGVRVIRGLE